MVINKFNDIYVHTYIHIYKLCLEIRYCSECSRGGAVPALLPADEPEQHDLPPHPPYPHRHHNDRCQLRHLLGRLNHAGLLLLHISVYRVFIK